MTAPWLLVVSPDLARDPLVEFARAVFSALREHPDADRAALLVRCPSLTPRDLIATCRALDRGRVKLFMSGRVDLASAIHADGVHLKERSVLTPDARAHFSGTIGRSRHDRAGIARSASAQPDYITLSPFDQVPGKNAPLGAAAFRALVAETTIPVLALGGVGLDNLALVLDAGADGVAVSRAVASDPCVASQLLERLSLHHHAS